MMGREKEEEKKKFMKLTIVQVQPLVFIDNVTAGTSVGMTCEVYGAILSAQTQRNTAELIRKHFIAQMDTDPMHTAKATQEFSKVKKCNT